MRDQDVGVSRVSHLVESTGRTVSLLAERLLHELRRLLLVLVFVVEAQVLALVEHLLVRGLPLLKVALNDLRIFQRAQIVLTFFNLERSCGPSGESINFLGSCTLRQSLLYLFKV